MRYRILLLTTAIATAMTACTVDVIGNPEGTAYEISAPCEQTKTTVDGLSTLWAENDALNVFAAESYGKFTYSGDDVFTGTMNSTVPDGSVWYALYPHDGDNISETSVSINIPAQSTQEGNDSREHLAGEGFPLYGRGTVAPGENSPCIPMHHAATVIRFVITNAEVEPLTINSITLSAPFALAGDFTADLTADEVKWTAGDENESSVTLDIEGGQTILNGHSAEFFVGAIPFCADAEYKIHVEGVSNGMDVESTKTFSKKLDFKAGKINTLRYAFKRTAAEDAPVPCYVKVTAAPSDWSGTYLIVSGDHAFNCNGSTSNYSASVEFENDGTILSTPTVDAYAVKFVNTGSKHAQNSNYYAYQFMSGNSYVYCSQAKVVVSSSASTYAHTLVLDSDGVQIMSARNSSSSSKYYFGYSSSAFGYQTSTTSGASSRRVQLYKLTGEGSESSQSSQNKAVYNLESTKLTAYLNEAEKEYSDENWTTVSVVGNYVGSGVGYDVPAPVTLSWIGYPDDTKTVTIYNDEALTETETSVVTTMSTAEIYNLIPGRTYWYTVTSSSHGVIASGTFDTEGRRRLMRVSTVVDKDRANNCRDLGGLKTKEGQLRYERIYRGSNVDETTDEEQAYLIGYMNIGSDIDLREVMNGSTNPMYSKAILDRNFVEHCADEYEASWNDLKDTTKLKRTFEHIYDCVCVKKKAAYIHCHIGADRTGYICMLLEALCGVSQKDCSIDYEITTLSVSGTKKRTGTMIINESMKYIQNYGYSSFQENARHILLDANVPDEHIQAFIDEMVE